MALPNAPRSSAAPAADLTIALLGPAQIALDGAPLAFAYEKAQALLIYLAVEAGRAHRRASLAELLWPDQDEAGARHNLSQALFTLRRALRDTGDEPLLLATRETVQLNPARAVWVDVAAFRALRVGGPPQLERAAELCRGEFLEGFGIAGSLGFEEWALLTREELRAQACDLLRRLTDPDTGVADPARLCAYARGWVAHDPLDEAAHRRLMRALAASGQRAAALLQYEQCSRLLDAELGIAPEPATVALYEELRQAFAAAEQAGPPPPPLEVGPRQPPAPPAPRPHNLPAPTTPFVGREAELAQLRAMLGDSGHRLVTLAGPGGIGKTRLALQVAAELAQGRAGLFADGVYLAELAGASPGDGLLPAIAGAVALPRSGGRDLRQQLLAFLRERSALLVLDNLEHLVEGAHLLSDLLQSCPGVTILTTSRVRLQLYEETCFELEGFPLPDAADGAAAAASSAVQLFVQRARRVRHSFDPDAEFAELVRICRMLGGTPLAIELAAGWTRTHTCRAIADEIQRSLDFLTTGVRNVPERHRSMRGVFAHSWRLLGEPERAGFARLTVFRGGFDQRAAEEVAGVSLATLRSLADASMIQPGPTGRYRIHELLRQLGADELTADDADASGWRHCRYFAAFLAERAGRLATADEPAAEAEIAGELENVRAAWLWAIARAARPGGAARAAEALAWGAPVLAAYYDHRSCYDEGLQLFQQAARALGDMAREADTPDDCRRLALVRVSLGQALLCLALSRFHEVEQIIGPLLALAQADALQRERAEALVTLGRAHRRMGRFDEATAELRRGLELFRALGDEPGGAEALNCLASVASGQGRDAEALRLADECLAIFEARGYRRGVARMLNNAGTYHARLGAYAESQRRHEQAYAIVGALGETGLLASVLSNLGASARNLGEHGRALAYYDEALRIFRLLGEQRWVAATLNGRGMALLDSGDHGAARRSAREALAIAQAIGSAQDMLESVAVLGESLVGDGSAPDLGLAVASFAAHYPVTPTIPRRRAARLIERLRAQLPDERWGAAVARGRASALDEAMAQIAELAPAGE